MRSFVTIPIVCIAALAWTLPARAQVATPDPEQSTAQPAAAAPAFAGFDTARSLFDVAPNQFTFGGRFNSVNGDPARWQRYQDYRNGVLFTDARITRHDTAGRWMFSGTADNVGYYDQRYSAHYEQAGRFAISGLWDQIPQFYSVDTKTPFTTSRSPLLLPDAAQLAAQSGRGLSVYVPIASQFDLRERRDIGNVSLLATPTPNVDVTAGFTSTKHSGELPWGASFGFSNDVEVALPYDSRTNDVNVGAEWSNNREMLRVGYTGSWFNNLDDTLVWDNPLRLIDSTTAPGQGRTALWPTNSAQTVSVSGYTKLAHKTQVTGFLSYGLWSNDEPLLPFTINSALPQLTLPRANTEGSAHVTSANLNLVSRPQNDWRFSARLRTYDYSNQTPQAAIPQFINYDTSLATSATGGPELFAHTRTTFDADATWTKIQPLALTIGYSRNNGGYDERIFESTGENVLRLTADAVGTQWLTFRANYEYSDRSGSGLDEASLTAIGEQPALRHYDIADRTRNRFTGQVDIVPNELWTFSASAGFGTDHYDNSYFGLTESTFRTVSFAADYRMANGFGGGGSYNYERYFGAQRSRSASPGQENDPNRDWTTDSTEDVNYFSIFLTPPRFARNTEARLSYDFSYAEGHYLYGVVPGGPLPAPSQLPKVYNKLQQLHLDVRHRLTNHLAGTFNYLYEPFRVYDFALDPTVVNGIAQPSSLVLGYVYRPYTANMATIGIKYLW